MKSPLFLCSIPSCQNDGLSCDAKLTENKKRDDDQTWRHDVHAPQTFPNKPSVTFCSSDLPLSKAVEVYIK